jgi:hypothetical protein
MALVKGLISISPVSITIVQAPICVRHVVEISDSLNTTGLQPHDGPMALSSEAHQRLTRDDPDDTKSETEQSRNKRTISTDFQLGKLFQKQTMAVTRAREAPSQLHPDFAAS